MSLRSFANLEYEVRVKKAKKISDLLTRKTQLQGKRGLDIGTGAGVCAEFFASQVVGPHGSVVAIDRSDQRLEKGQYHFEIVEGVELPFDNNSFDIVVSNHVIEHVGGFNNKSIHLKEISRVLKRGGILYLAFPNRFAVIEPHYNLPFLSWFPQWFADFCVKGTGKGEYFDCHTPTRGEFVQLLKETDLNKTEITKEVFTYVVENELAGNRQVIAKLLSPFLLPLFMPIMPTLVHILIKK